MRGMDMRVSCIQMDMALGQSDANFARAAALVRETAEREHPDAIVLPETWNTGFFPADVASCADVDGARTKETFSPLAKACGVNIIAGSVANRKRGRVYNTAYVFDRAGECVAEYDKTHLFTPMGEDKSFAAGDTLCRFALDGVDCAVIICYDVRFPELVRTLALPGLDVLFIVSQWPQQRMLHLHTLARARAIENQMFAVLCNACGLAGKTRFGGGSTIVDPWGATLAEAGAHETTVTATLEMSILADIRASIPVFQDRRPELYDC